jgi:hypothetical protein
MSLIASLKRTIERVTGRGRPGRRELDALVRPRKARALRFKDDGLVSRFRSSHALAATSDANFGIKGTLATLWF